jgi:glucose-1-phosphate thymidylyltransferase
MKVIIPLAGYGTRLRPHTFTKPKPLINVAGKPVLGHILDTLKELDISEYIFIVGYLGDQIAEYIDTEYNVPARYVEQKDMLGQSHAIYLAKEYLDDEPVFIVFGDHIFEADYNSIKQPKSDAVIFVKEVEDPRKYGVVMLDENEHVTSFVEKAANPPTNLAIIGLYYINNGNKLVEALDWQINDVEKKTKGEYYIADALQRLVDGGMSFGIETVPAWLDCGNPSAVLAANRYLLSEGGYDNSDQIQFPNAIICPPVRIDPTATINQAIIGPNVTVAANCMIENAIVKDSILGEGSAVKDALLERSLIGQNAYVGGRYRSFNVGDSSSIDFSDNTD